MKKQVLNLEKRKQGYMKRVERGKGRENDEIIGPYYYLKNKKLSMKLESKPDIQKKNGISILDFYFSRSIFF